jgi:ribonuclease Z
VFPAVLILAQKTRIPSSAGKTISYLPAVTAGARPGSHDVYLKYKALVWCFAFERIGESMATLYLLGTGAVMSDPERTTTMLGLDNDRSLLLVDCGSDAVQRFKSAGVDPLRLRHLIVTHEHADHVGGFPLLLERLWVEGLRGEFHVHGLRSAIDQARRVHDAFDTAGWADYPEIIYHEVACEAGAEVLNDDGWHITAAPGLHAVPVIGLRVTDRVSGGVMAYSADTSPSPVITELARSAQLLLHEATGDLPGHSTASQAAEVAAAAGAGELILIHLPPERWLGPAELAAARQIFPNTTIAAEGGHVTF